MHRSTPADTLHRSYDSGGARSTVDQVDDTKLMQEMAGNFLKGEARKAFESPQNYGFTSVVRDALKGADGQISECAEAFISFLGGNRSFPVCTVMDDRRFRLKNLEKGDVAIFDYLQHQLHFNKDGVFLTGRTDKKVRFQLFDPPQQQQQSGGGSGKAATRAANGSSSSSSSSSDSSSSSSSSYGQTKRYDQQGKQYLEMTKDTTNLVHDQTINYKTGVHTFSPPDGATARDGNPLVKIMGDKFTQGFGTFVKQVSAADPILPQHLVTKRYLDAILDGGGGGGGGGGLVTSATPPMNISSGNLTLAYQDPLYLNVDTLGLKIAAPLTLDGSGRLTSSITEAPSNGQAYGRVNAGWQRVLAITGDVLDGGNF
jgi:phage gp45-like